MSDLIRRGDVLDALIEKGQKSKRYEWGDRWELNLFEIKEAVESVPSAETERKWIPFEVALPNDRQKVLCVNKHDEMMVGGYMSDYGMTFPCYFEKPIAWMPLPEPWRGE